MQSGIPPQFHHNHGIQPQLAHRTAGVYRTRRAIIRLRSPLALHGPETIIRLYQPTSNPTTRITEPIGQPNKPHQVLTQPVTILNPTAIPPQSFLNLCTYPDRTIDRRIIGQHSFDHTAHHPTTRSHTFTYHKILTQSIIPQQSYRNHGIPSQSVNKTAGEYRTRGGADKPT